MSKTSHETHKSQACPEIGGVQAEKGTNADVSMQSQGAWESGKIIHIPDVPYLSLRDYFAAKAMEGVVASLTSESIGQEFVKLAQERNTTEAVIIARFSYNLADAMLRFRNGGAV